MKKKLNFKEKYLVFIKHNKRNTDRQVLIALALTLLAIAYYIH